MYSVSALDLLLFIREKGKYSENMSLNSYLKDVKIHRDIKAIKVDNDIEDLYDVALSQNYIPIVDDRNVFSGIVTRKAVMNWLINKNKDIK
jgi:CBS domain-containing protein